MGHNLHVPIMGLSYLNRLNAHYQVKRLSMCNALVEVLYTVKPVLSDHIKQDMFLAFLTGGCLLLHENFQKAFCATIIQQ